MSTPSTSGIAIERRGPVTRIHLDRPELHNAFDDRLIGALTETFEKLGDEPGVRAVVLAGRGRSFCAGADLNWMKRMVRYTRDENLRDSRALARMFSVIDTCPKPVIARVHGAALGGGAGLVCVSDVAIGVPDVRIGFTEVKLGILPAVISPYVIRKIGGAHARELFMTGERIDGNRAATIGLLNHVVADEEALDAAVGRTIDMLLSSGPDAVGLAKALVRGVLDRTHDEAIDYSVETIADVRVSAEGQEGMTAFLDKRPAAFVIRRDEESA